MLTITAKDDEFHKLFRKHLILPFLQDQFLPQYSAENAGGHLFAFLKPQGGIRPLLCGSIFRRCFASLAAASITDECTEYFTRSFPNFLQCAGGLKDGTSICATILQLFDDAPVPEGAVWALLEIDLKNAFNEALRQAAFDVITGKAAREYDNGKVKVGDDLPSFPGLWRFFAYFRAMQDTASTLRYVDHKGQVHHVSGTSGGQQGDPLEMIRFCATIHPVWGRVMARYEHARALAFADDGYIHSELKDCLLILAELKHAFKEDCGLDLQLGKCKIFLKGMPIEEARSLVRDTIDADHRLHTLSGMLQLHDDQESNVIQVKGITCVGVPIGSPDFVTAFVKSKTKAMVDDVRKLQVLSNGLTHFRLVKFCHNTRLSYLNRNLPPAVMRNTQCGLQTVDTANAMEVLRRGTDTESHDPSTRFLCDKWNDAERQWHIRTVQIAHHLGGLGLTPQCASGIAAFYHSTARFVGWMAQMDAPERWLGSAQKLDQPDTWTASNLVALQHMHNELCQEYNCVEGMQDPPADAADADADGARADGNGPRPAVPLSLPPLNHLASQHVSEEEEACRLPLQRRVTSQVMRHWAQHTAIADNAPSARQRHLDALHKTLACDAISRTKAGEPGHSILQTDVPDGEDLDCEPSKRKKYRYSPAAFLSCFMLIRPSDPSSSTWPVAERKATWSSWFCQYIGVPIPKLQQATSPQLVCPCNRHIIDVHGDHIHTCKKHTGSRKDAHETILTALEQICNDSGFSTRRSNIPTVDKSNGKPGRGDLVVKDAHLGGFRDLVVDVVCTHEFGGSHLADVSLNGQLRDHDPNRLLENEARKKVERYRDGYANRNGTTYAFLPCAMTSSGRIHGEFLRLLYILAHRRTKKYFASLGDDEPGVDAFTWRRSQFFWQHRAAIGLANAVAVARRAHLAHPARPRLRAHPSPLDPSLSQPPPPPPRSQ